jgi:hypothetical protein
MGRKYKSSPQGSDLAPFVGNGTKIKIPSEVKPPLVQNHHMEMSDEKERKIGHVKNEFNDVMFWYVIVT